jgi:hypothetical protein
MEKKDLIEDKFRSSFSDFEKEPPSRVWKNVQRNLHQTGPWSRFLAFLHLSARPLGFYLAWGGVTAGVILTVFLIGTRKHGVVRGHAYAGEARLHNGIADLFCVSDNTLPWDSVAYSRSAMIDNYGHFQFSNIGSGNYLLRITPDKTTGESDKYLPSWYEHDEKSDSCKLIVIDGKDVNVEIQLIEKTKH